MPIEMGKTGDNNSSAMRHTSLGVSAEIGNVGHVNSPFAGLGSDSLGGSVESPALTPRSITTIQHGAPNLQPFAGIRSVISNSIPSSDSLKEHFRNNRGLVYEHGYNFQKFLIDWAIDEKPTAKLVSMSDGNKITVTSADKEEHKIGTMGLGGCTAAAIFSEDQNGTRNVAFTHYPLDSSDPHTTQQNIIKINQLTTPDMKTALKKSAVIMAPGEWVKNSETGRYTMAPDMNRIEPVVAHLKKQFGDDLQIKFVAYSQAIDVSNKNAGTLLITVPPVGQGEPKWESGTYESGTF